MKHRKTLLSASVFAALCFAGAAAAQDAGAAPNGADPQQNDSNDTRHLGTIEVHGIRGSTEASLQLKKSADSHISVVTAEDIGKLPAKNVADTLQRLPGVNISTQSGNEGGFDEDDRVSLRGTNPNLTLTTINGHSLGTGDWFVLSQAQTVGRAISYSLLPAEIVKEVVVHKSSEAKFLEGGAAGTVNVITRKPLEFPERFTGQVTFGGVYADLPGKTTPQASALFNFKNGDNTLGLMLQVFYEKRELRRDGQEVVGGYVQVAPTDPVVAAHPDLANVFYPNLIGATSFLQTRKRKGGAFDIEFKPSDNWTLDLNGLYSKLDADNQNRNFMLWPAGPGNAGFLPQGVGLQPGYTVKNNVLTSATFAPRPGNATPYAVYDQIMRPGASSKSSYVALNAKWQATQNLAFNGEIGTLDADGRSPTQNVIETNQAAGAGAHWQMNGPGNPISWGLIDANASSPAASGATPGFIFGDQNIDVQDDEDWYKIDGSLYFDNSVLSSLDFGLRYANHTREDENHVIGQGPQPGFFALDLSKFPFSHYPGGFADGLGGDFPRNVWTFTPAQIAAINAQFSNKDPVARFHWADLFSVNEKDSAAYLQANFTGNFWSGNLGVRAVRTKESISYNTAHPDEFTVAGPITGSAFGNFFKSHFEHSYSKLLPSGNLKFDLRDDLVLRLAASQTLTRPNYSALSGVLTADDLTHTGNGGNPRLKPLVSTNEDVSLEWYFTRRGLLSASAFNMDLKDYVTFANQPRQLVDVQASNAAGRQITATYLISEPTNVDGTVHGVELNYIQPIGEYFGVAANYTYAKGHADTPTGDEPLQGTSKNTYNLQAYFENDRFNVRMTYSYRSEFFAGVDRSDNFYQQNYGTLALSAGYMINDWMTLSLDALNLNNPELDYVVKNDAIGTQPHSEYKNGRQYYLTLTVKF